MRARGSRGVWMILTVCVALVFATALPVLATAPETTEQGLTLRITADAEPFEDGYIAEVGVPVRFTFLVSNTGTATVTGIAVDEPTLGHIGDIDSLDPGESRELSVSSDTADGTLAGTAAGIDPAGLPVVASGTLLLERFFGDTFEDDAWITKAASVRTVVPGDTVRYTLTYGNKLDTLTGTTSIVDSFDPLVFEVIDAGGARVTSGVLTWAVPEALRGTDAPRRITYALRVRTDVPKRYTAAINTVRIVNDLDVDAANNEATVTLPIDHYLGFTPSSGSTSSTKGPVSAHKVGASSSGDEPFLPFTGAYELLSGAAFALAALSGGALRRYGTSTC